MQAAVTAGTLTGVTVSAVTDATRVTSTTTGERTDLTVVITGGAGSTAASTVNVTTQGTDSTVATATSYTITASSPHSPSSVAATFANDLSAAACLTQIRNHFVNDDIGGYSESAITGTSFLATSDTTGNETDLTFAITNAGTNGDLVFTSSVTTQGAAQIITGTPTTWTAVIDGNTYSTIYSSGADATAQLTEVDTYLSAMNVDAVVTGNSLKIQGANNGPGSRLYICYYYKWNLSNSYTTNNNQH